MAAMQVLSLELSLKSSAAEGFLSAVRGRFPRLTVQLVTFGKVPNGRMLELIGNQTITALAEKSLLASKPEVDLLLRVAGTSQIEEALRRVGYGRSGKKVLLAIGDGRALARVRRHCIVHAPGATPLVKSPLSRRELEKVEEAALLGARKC